MATNGANDVDGAIITIEVPPLAPMDHYWL
jgi:hypothetical protein